MSTISKSMQIMPPNEPWRRDLSFVVIEVKEPAARPSREGLLKRPMVPFEVTARGALALARLATQIVNYRRGFS